MKYFIDAFLYVCIEVIKRMLTRIIQMHKNIFFSVKMVLLVLTLHTRVLQKILNTLCSSLEMTEKLFLVELGVY